MAKSQYEYVKSFELPDSVLPQTYLVVRIDGRAFHKFSAEHNFRKPNDKRALDLMNRCAEEIMKEYQEVEFAIGESDEFSFVLKRYSNLFNRRASKIQSVFASYFASNYVFYWKTYFGDEPLKYPPSFDARVVCYPTYQSIRDYLSWRQVDCHINNLYNTTFWTLVLKGGKTEKEAELIIRPTNSAVKNEILFGQFNVNYNEEPAIFRKGSQLYKIQVDEPVINSKTGEETTRKRWKIAVTHEDIIADGFWKANPHLLQ